MSDLISRQVLDLWDRYKPTIVVDAIEYDRELKQLLSTNLAEVGTDLISRQAAIDAIRTVIGDNRSISVCEAVKKLPPIQPEPHWIPVTERLPETDDEVLTTYIVNGNRKKRYVETSRYYYDGFSGYWSSPWDEYRIAGTRIEVIAWMPLPEAFKGVTT